MDKNLHTFSKALFFRNSILGTLADMFLFVLFPSVVEHIADGVNLCRSFISIRTEHARYFLERNAIFYNMIHSHLPGPLRNVFSQVLLAVYGYCNRQSYSRL